MLLERLAADEALTAQTTADDVAESKPAPEVFLKAMERRSIDPERALAVGDSIWDVQAAHAAGIACLAVETGGFSQHGLSEARALRVYRDVQKLTDQFWTSPLTALSCASRAAPTAIEVGRAAPDSTSRAGRPFHPNWARLLASLTGVGRRRP